MYCICNTLMRLFLLTLTATLTTTTSSIVFAAYKSEDGYDDSSPVTYGSTIKLKSILTQRRLHSHQVTYGNLGSGQQSVTAVRATDDSNSLWLVRGSSDDKSSKVGEVIKCGSKIRLFHVNTRKHLHSHQFPSPLSGNQEISCFGSMAESDGGDVWELLCNKADADWTANMDIALLHVDTKALLATGGNLFNRPIEGQAEVFGVKSRDKKQQISFSSVKNDSKWRAAEGFFVTPKS